MVLKKRYKSMRDAALTVISRYYFHVLCRQHLDNFTSVNPLTFFVFVFVYLSIFMMPKTLFAFWLMSTISFSLFLVLFQSNTQRNFLCFLLLWAGNVQHHHCLICKFPINLFSQFSLLQIWCRNPSWIKR